MDNTVNFSETPQPKREYTRRDGVMAWLTVALFACFFSSLAFSAMRRFLLSFLRMFLNVFAIFTLPYVFFVIEAIVALRFHMNFQAFPLYHTFLR